MFARLIRTTHRLHRALGSLLWWLLASWFLSGAVMTFGGFPRVTERERLRAAEPVMGEVSLPPALVGFDGELRLAQLEGEARWLFTQEGVRRALSAAPPHALEPLDEARARRVAQRVGPVRSLRLLRGPDQWTVPLPSGLFPLWHAQLDDSQASELYLCAATGERVQQTTRAARALAWLGAIPHWIYPTLLRRERVLWRNTVLVLATLGIALTLFGLTAGLDMQRRLRRKQRVVRDVALRWHQRLGLGFGLLCCAWLFSGALSFTPFAWTGRAALARSIRQRLDAPVHDTAHVAATLALCAAQLTVRELSLTRLLGNLYALCSDGQRSLLVRQQMPLVARPALTDQELRALGDVLVTPPARATITHHVRPDAYHYPSHFAPDVALPFVTIRADDADETSFYIDARRAQLLTFHTRRSRLERWLYHGLHSWDHPWLTAHPRLWQGLLLTAMALGGALSLLGGWLSLRRQLRRARRGPGSAARS